MRRLFPAPLLSAALVVLWLLLNEPLSIGHTVLALLFGLLLPPLFASLRPQRPRIRRPLRVLQLILVVGRDVLLSNLQVGSGVLRLRRRQPQSAFVTIPLELRDPNALAVLAVIVCITPGTAWAELSMDRSLLRLHVLEVGDPQAIIDHVKQRYERPLMEIFE